MKPVKIALVGNPNCGKTTMFNNLTGASQYVGNWPGVTVEKKEGKLRDHKDVVVTDLPGIYSLSPYTLEEVITRGYLLDEKPDVILNLIDGSNIERNLYLTTQLAELGIPMVVALNMIDVVRRQGDEIDVDGLARALGCSVIPTDSVRGEGLDALIGRAVALSQAGDALPVPPRFGDSIETPLAQIAEILSGQVLPERERWFAVKLFERDEKARAQIALSESHAARVEEIVSACEEALDDDGESIVTNERYAYIATLVGRVVRKKRVGMTASDRIDQIVTNRWLALPIFAAVMWLVYFVSVSWLGAIVTDWTNDTLFGEMIIENTAAWMEAAEIAPWLISLIVDGIISGVGAVLGFVPQMLILFLFLSILEDCGYMARVAFIMDRIFRKFGLSGKSFIPILISSGCGVPGIMASRTIENEKDRRMTIILTTFIPCGAKLPIIALIGGALFPDQTWVAPAMYFMGVGAIILSGIILKKTALFVGDPAPFVMELPQYRIPGAKGVFIHMWERGRSFIVKAGTVIFVACAIIWFLSSFGFEDGGFGMVDTEISLLAVVGTAIAPLFAPLGFGDWKAAVATITGLVAKENVVGTFGVLFGIAEAAEDDPALLGSVSQMFTTVSALSFMVFNLLCAPCFAAIGAIRREMGNWKWTGIAVGYQTLLAYVVSFITYQLGSVVALGAPLGAGAAVSFALLAAIVWLLARHYDPGKTTRRPTAPRAKVGV